MKDADHMSGRNRFLELLAEPVWLVVRSIWFALQMLLVIVSGVAVGAVASIAVITDAAVALIAVIIRALARLVWSHGKIAQSERLQHIVDISTPASRRRDPRLPMLWSRRRRAE